MGYGAIAGQDFWLVKNRYNQNDYELTGSDFVLGNAYTKACKIRTSVDVKMKKYKCLLLFFTLTVGVPHLEMVATSVWPETRTTCVASPHTLAIRLCS